MNQVGIIIIFQIFSTLLLTGLMITCAWIFVWVVYRFLDDLVDFEIVFSPFESRHQMLKYRYDVSDEMELETRHMNVRDKLEYLKLASKHRIKCHKTRWVAQRLIAESIDRLEKHLMNEKRAEKVFTSQPLSMRK